MFGNLDNLSLGMGLKAKPEQRIHARHAALDGWQLGSEEAKRVTETKKSFGLLGTLFILVVAYKLLNR